MGGVTRSASHLTNAFTSSGAPRNSTTTPKPSDSLGRRHPASMPAITRRALGPGASVGWPRRLFTRASHSRRGTVRTTATTLAAGTRARAAMRTQCPRCASSKLQRSMTTGLPRFSADLATRSHARRFCKVSWFTICHAGGRPRFLPRGCLVPPPALPLCADAGTACVAMARLSVDFPEPGRPHNTTTAGSMSRDALLLPVPAECAIRAMVTSLHEFGRGAQHSTLLLYAPRCTLNGARELRWGLFARCL